MRDTTESPVTVEEVYAAARNASDLRVDPDRRRPVDTIIAAACAHSDLSFALSDLRAQWDRAPKVKRPTEETIRVLAHSYPKRGKPDFARARAEALVWHTRQLREQMARLHAMGKVIEMVTPWVIGQRLDPALIRVAIYHWLDDSCPACDGRGNDKAKDAPVLMAIQCLHCHGTGAWPESRQVSEIRGLLKDAMSNATKTMRGKLDGRN
jgi:hypothetical protein